MDITPQDTTQQPMSDDQELAKALAGVLPDAPEEPEAPKEDAVASTADSTATTPAPSPAVTDAAMQFEETPAPAPAAPTTSPVVPPAAASDLDAIKKNALTELRPLIDKVDLPAEEKFDTYLMMIRSTDDPSLIEPAHTAAQAISDEKRRAEALLDIVKEIDYLSASKQPTA